MGKYWTRASYIEKLLLPLQSRATDSLIFQTLPSREIIAYNYRRIVVGDRGPYIEFDTQQVLEDHLHIPPDQFWRTTPYWRQKAYFCEYRTNLDKVMIYLQLRTVSYADYKTGYFYVSPWHLTTDQHDSYLATGDPPSWLR